MPVRIRGVARVIHELRGKRIGAFARRPRELSGLVLVCVLAVSGLSGCTSRSAGQALAQVLVGVVSVVAHAAISGSGPSRHGYDMPEREAPREATCVSRREEWFEVHQGSQEELPAHLHCTPDGDWPESSMAVVSSPEPSASEGAEAEERTAGSTAVCGGTETEQQRCEGMRAVQEQRRRGGPTRLQW